MHRRHADAKTALPGPPPAEAPSVPSRAWSGSVFLRYPWCDVNQVAMLLGVSSKVAMHRYETGDLEHLVLRTSRGDEWRPSGRHVFDAYRVRAYLDPVGQELFDAWQQGGELQAREVAA